MEREHPFVELARRAIRTYLATGEVIDPPAEPDDPPPSGVFVSLHHPARPGEMPQYVDAERIQRENGGSGFGQGGV